jgi:hypothetical protein
MNRIIEMAACGAMTALLVFSFGESSQAAHRSKRGKAEGSFNMIGTVARHVGAITCMHGNILYDLISADHQITAPLSTSSKTDEDVLEKAANLNGWGWVRVEGVWEVGVESGCRWVKVSRVTPARRK